MTDHLRQGFGLGDPVLDDRLGGDAPNPVRSRGVEFSERRGEVGGVALGQLGGRIDASSLEEVRLFGPDAVDAH